MENKRTWGVVRNAIAEAQGNAAKQRLAHVAGPSEVSIIYQKLLEKGFLKPEFQDDPKDERSLTG